MRNTTRYPVQGPNALWQLYKNTPFFKVCKCVFINQMARYAPSFVFKNWLYRNFLNMQVGEQTSVALMVMMDVLYPELISIGDNTTIGFNTTILTHEYLVHEYRLGRVIIGNNVLIGANSLIMPGVTIGDGAIVSAGTYVYRDVPAGSFVGGNPMQIIYEPGDPRHPNARPRLEQPEGDLAGILS